MTVGGHNFPSTPAMAQTYADMMPPGTAVTRVSDNSKLMHEAALAALEGNSTKVPNVAIMLKKLLTKLLTKLGRIARVMPSHPLSHFERLPTELVQAIASHLIEPYDHDEPLDYVKSYGLFECKDLLPLRLTSRTIAAKVDFVFTYGFRFHVVQYSEEGIRRLLCLSKTVMRKRVSALIFVAARDTSTAEENSAQPVSNPTAASGNEVSRKLSKEGALKTTMLVKALKKFPSTLLAICVAPSLNKNYPYEVLTDSIKQHPPTVILYATLQSKRKIKYFHVDPAGFLEWGSCDGICLHASLQFPSAHHLEAAFGAITLTLSEVQCA